MSTNEIAYGLALDFQPGKADDQTAKAFQDIRAAAIELDGAPECDNPLIPLIKKTLERSPALQYQLLTPESAFVRRIASAGANACSSAYTTDAFARGE